MPGSDGKTYCIGFYVLLRELFFANLAVGGGCGMNNKALDIRHIGKQGKNLQAVNKPVCRLYAAPDFKGKDGAAAMGKIFLIELVVRMLR